MSTLETLRHILIRDYKVPVESLSADAPLSQLGIDSLGLLELMFKIEDHYHIKIPGDPPTNLATVQDVVAYIDSLLAAAPPTPAASAAPLPKK